MNRAIWSLCFIAVFVLCFAEKHAIERSREVILHSTNIDTTSALNIQTDLAHLTRVRQFNDDVQHQYLVHVARSISTEEKKSLEDHIGAKFSSYIPHNTFLLYADQQAASRAASHQLVQWVGDYAPQYKIATSLDNSAEKIIVTLAPKADRTINDASTIATSWSSSLKNVKVEALSSDKIAISGRNLQKTARWVSEQPESHFIEPAVQYISHNAFAKSEVLSHSNGNTLVTNGLNGAGQVVGLADSGLRTTSCYFSNGGASPGPAYDPSAYKVVRYVTGTGGDNSDATGHGSAVAGTIAGNRFGGVATDNGIAPNAKIHFTDIQSGTGALNIPANVADLFTNAKNDGVSIFVAPFGTSNATWYGTDAQSIDAYIYNNPNFLVITSSGNDKSLSSLALSKNALVVGSSMSSIAGVVNQQSPATVTAIQASPSLYGPHVVSSFSGRGPTPDGRLKPDVTAPGESLYTVSNSADCALASVKGTSYAAGAAGGAAALVRQFFNESFYPGGSSGTGGFYTNPSAALMKAMLIHSGQPLELVDLNGNGNYKNLEEYPSAEQGFGRIQLDQALIGDYSSTFINIFPDPTTTQNSVSTGTSLRYCLQASSNTFLKATLVWTDKDSTPAAGHILVNDLDLAVVAQDGTTYRTSTAGGQFDSFNNVEQVLIPNVPNGAIFAFHVHGRNVPVGPQIFSLVITGNLNFAACIGDFNDGVSGNRTCPGLCSGKGTCNAQGFCTCNAGYEGMDCSLSPCSITNGLICGGNGYCDYETSTCVCASGYASPTCVGAIVPPQESTSTESNKGGISSGLLAGTVVAAFIVGAICSVFLGGFLAVKYLEYRRDKIAKDREREAEEMS